MHFTHLLAESFRFVPEPFAFVGRTPQRHALEVGGYSCPENYSSLPLPFLVL